MEESIIEKVIKEYKELKEYKRKYESQKIDKEKMSEALYEFELKEYKNTTYEQRVKKHIEENCKDCRYFYGENRHCKWLEGTPKERLPKDILKPIQTKENYFPGHKICEDFLWD